MPKAKAKKSDKAGKKVSTHRDDVIYPEVKVNLCLGDKALDAEKAKQIMGWQEEVDKLKFGSMYLLKNTNGAKVRCTNNVTNRPLYMSVVLTLKQEILRGKWRFNGEPIIVGQTGLVENGQHQLTALILATEEWEANKENYPHLKEAPTIDKLIVFGIEESDAVVNTMDTCKPRSLADVIYRSEYFGKLKETDRRKCARVCDYAIRLLWHRTGATLDAFAPRRTHAESLDFLDRHPKLLDSVKHIYEEDGKEGKIGRYINVGHAAGLLYLMGSCTSDRDEYLAADNPSEKQLDWENWEKACEFFNNLAAGNKETAAVRSAINGLIESGGGTVERWAIIASAWNSFLKNKKVAEKDVHLEFVEDANGVSKLSEIPRVGGIDIGDPKEIDEGEIEAEDPTPEQIEKRARSVKSNKGLRPKMKGKTWAKGDVAWVRDNDGEHYLATVTDSPYDCDDDDTRVMVAAADGEWDVSVKDLSLERPKNEDEAEEDEEELFDVDEGEAHKSKKTSKVLKSSTDTSKSKGKKVFAVKDTVWVKEPKKEPWRGKIVEIEPKGRAARITIGQGHQGAGNTVVVPVSCLSVEQPR